MANINLNIIVLNFPCFRMCPHLCSTYTNPARDIIYGQYIRIYMARQALIPRSNGLSQTSCNITHNME